MLLIRSTYEEYAPDHSTYPSNWVWAATPSDYAARWETVKAYLTQQHGWRELTQSQTGHVGLASESHEEPFAYFGDTLILNNAETIKE